jgi:1,4-dihydroxy-2-naphthoate octaprenyltransferase
MDTPPWVYRWIYGAPGLNGLAKATLGFCGIAPVRRTVFGPVKGSSEAVRHRWIAQARQEGARLGNGALTPSANIRRQVAAWVGALRLQFHPMAWIAYLIGALGAWHAGRPVQDAPFWLGLACLFSLEAATVFANDYFDQPSDRINKHYGPFTGGSRMLVDGRISTTRMRYGIAAALSAFGILSVALCVMTPWPMLPFLIGNAILAMGYTVPPLQLCWRGLGEIDVALTHSFSALLCGSLGQGEALGVPFPWLIGLPLFFAVLPAIILSGVPDFVADRASGKRSLTVCFGPRRGTLIAELITAMAAVTSLTWVPALGAAAWPAICIVVAYATGQIVCLERFRAAEARPRRVDSLMMLCLSFILLFVLSPLILLLIS